MMAENLSTVDDDGTEKVMDMPESVSNQQKEEVQFLVYQTHSTAVLLIFIIGVLVNSLVLLLFYRRPCLRSFSNRFIVSLSVTHLLQSVFVTPTILISAFADRWLFGQVWCQVSGAASISINVATVLSLLLIAVDRNYAVNSPLHYSMTVTKRRTGGLIISVWLISLLSALPPLLGVSRIDYRPQWRLCGVVWIPRDLCCIIYSSYLCLIGFVLPIAEMSWIYWSMFMAARNNSARARQHSLSSSNPEVSSIDSRSSKLCFSKRKILRKNSSQSSVFGEECKAAKTGMIILSTFTICWSPYFLTGVVESWISDLPKYLPAFVIFMYLSASVINPYIYVFRNKGVRKQVGKVIHCLSRFSCLYDGHRSSYRNRRTPGNVLSPRMSHASEYPSRSIITGSSIFTDRSNLWKIVSYIENDNNRNDLIEDSVCHLSDDYLVQPVDLETEGYFVEGHRAFRVGRGSLGGDVFIPGHRCSERRSRRNSAEALSVRYMGRSFEDDPRSTERLVYGKFRRGHRDSTASANADGACSSIESSSALEEMSSAPRKLSQGDIFSRPLRPPLKRVQSEVEEQELSMFPNFLSKLGSYRRDSFGTVHVKSQESSETTLTSSTSTDSQELPQCILLPSRVRPKLVRQHSAVLSYPEGVRSYKYDDPYISGRRNSVCYFVG